MDLTSFAVVYSLGTQSSPRLISMTKPDQQGYLGHLVDKSKEELIDLLKRQEILVKNQ